MKKTSRVILILAVILCTTAVGIWYVNTYILPVKIKALIIKTLEEKSGCTITIGSMGYIPLSSFYLSDIKIYEKGSTVKVLADISRISVNMSLWPLLKEKKLVAKAALKGLSSGGTTINGTTSFSLKRNPSPARRPFLNDIEGIIHFTNFSVVNDTLPADIKKMTGAVVFQQDSIRLDDTYFKCDNVVYNMDGSMTGLDTDEPKALVALNSEILKSKGEFTLKSDYLKIDSITGKLLESSFNIMGDVKWPEGIILNLYSEAKLDLADLKKLFPKSVYIMDSLKPAGICDAALFFNGALGRIKDAEASVKLSSYKVFLQGLALDDLYVDLRMNDGIIETERFTIKPYLGLLTGSFSMDLNKERLPFTVSFLLKDGNVAKFSADMNLGQENMSGFVSSKFFLKGYGSDPDAIRGSGWVTITGGNLWEIPLLGGVSDALKMSGLRSVIFKEVVGNFVIDNRRLSTDDLTFYSQQANMHANGWLDFDGNIDIRIDTDITQDLIEGDSDAAMIANLLLTQAGNYMGRIRITGTTDEPKYEMAAKPVGKLLKKKAGGNIGELLQNKAVQGLIKDLLE